MWVEYVIRKIFGFKGAELRNYFDDLELDKVVPKLLQYAFEQATCENIVWLTADEYNRVKQTQSDTNPLRGDALVDRNLKIQAMHAIDDEALFGSISKFANLSTMPQQSEKTEGDKTDLLIPIQCHREQKPIAFLILLGVQKKSAEKAMIKLSQDLSYMQKHIGFSLQHWNAQRLSLHDDLTGLYNQKYMSTVLEGEIARAQREKSKFTVLFIDVDYFKSVNDHRGHWVGSKLLVEIAQIFKNSIRRCDYAFRYGGDEFVIILPQTSAQEAIPLAERLRETIEKTNFIIDGQKLQLTLSVGIACYPDHAQTYKDILKMADEAMYSAKHKSRNIVFVAG